MPVGPIQGGLVDGGPAVVGVCAALDAAAEEESVLDGPDDGAEAASAVPAGPPVGEASAELAGVRSSAEAPVS